MATGQTQGVMLFDFDRVLTGGLGAESKFCR